jgi:DNA-binding response OmpR family regulator
MQTSDEMNAKRAATIVLADDDSDPRDRYARCLRQAGHVVWEAADGAQALALVRGHAPDLLLLDMWMPIFNGLEVVERLASDPRAVGLKVVMLSDQTDADTRLEGLALGVLDYWTKGLSLISLRERVDNLVGLAQAGPGQSS